MKIAIYGNSHQDNRIGVIDKMFSSLALHGVDVEAEKGFYEYVKKLLPETKVGCADDSRLSADIVLSVGGDGTFLRAASWVGDREIPIFGINTGHLGYLSGATTDSVEQMLDDIRNGRYRTESRSLIQVDADPHGSLPKRFALNEVAVLKDSSASMLHMDTTVNGAALNTYIGDGLIVATPTGSTAYNLSVGGPILHPACRSFVISPIAAHSLTVRPLVLPDGAEIAVRTRSTRSQTFRISVDGESSTLPIGTVLRLRRADFCVKVALRDGHNFAGTLRGKLMWGVDGR